MYSGNNYIKGDFEETRNDFRDINPTTEVSLGTFPQSDPEEVNRAVAAARKAQKAWRRLSRVERGEYLKRVAHLLENKYAERLAIVISEETGKNHNESIAEVNEALHMAEYAWASAKQPYGEMIASELADKDSYMLRKPVGVVGIISPWNFPVAIGGFWNAAPALVEGNTVVWKPSEDTPMSAQIVAELYDDAGIPPGVFNLIHGNGEVGAMLVESDVNCILFTGSAEVGQLIRQHCASTWNKTCSCEMGSKSACLIFNDASMDLAIPACVASSFKLSGQRCVSSGRHLIQREIYDEFCAHFVEETKKISTGPWRDQMHFYGPLINEAQYHRVKRFNDTVRDDPRCEVLLKGEDLRGNGIKGYFLKPFVFKSEWTDAAYLRQEVFGPHVALIPFDTVDDAIKIYNDTDYGLAVGIITNDFKIARKCRDECDYGMCYWNGGSIAAESHLGFGGVKKSGNGYSSAARTYRAVTHEVAWTVNHAEGIQFPQGMKTR